MIGFGVAGQAFHAPVISGVRGMELVCILERKGSRAREKYPDVRVVRTLDELLADKGIQLCVICLLYTSHEKIARYTQNYRCAYWRNQKAACANRASRTVSDRTGGRCA